MQRRISPLIRFDWLTQVQDPFKASSILIQPTAHNGSGALCKIERQLIDGKVMVLIKTKLAFYFQKRKYIFNETTKRFEKLDYLHSKKHPMRYFKDVKGLDTKTAGLNETKYGLNRFEIPIPSFQELFKEHMVAPFFIFQLFCVALWFLDEMWYYSLFTLFMLVLFEATVVFQRLKTLQEFRSMAIPPYPIMVYRNQRWIELTTEKLLPGDICSVNRQTDDHPVASDFLLLNGSCIANEAMLSGESTPQLKESIMLREDKEIFKLADDKSHVLFGGTKILQVTPPDQNARIKTPDGGCLAIVLRNGFATQQGKLVRTIIYSTERVTANNMESFVFILFLLFFAIIASWYVWNHGSKESDRDRSKLLLHCIMIVTSVVPPELPMELSLAVNNALMSLSQAFIYCTEPFRIPFAGRIDVACFDKTGTLTAENLVVEGITGLTKGLDQLSPCTSSPKETIRVLASAHALVKLDDGVIGDPMEKNTLDSIGWNLGKGDVVSGLVGKQKESIVILRRFPFSSALKRMSTISYIGDSKKYFVSVKGAPETIKQMLKTIPEHYDEHYKYWARRGKRVLALAYKEYDQTDKAVKDFHRDEVEADLRFCGFLIFYCPLKPDSKQAIAMLNKSSHRTVMITGDNALTACHIAGEVGIINGPVLIADVWKDDDGARFSWRSPDESIVIKDFNLKDTKVPQSMKSFALCCTGAALEVLIKEPCFDTLLPRVWIYARVSPSQKEAVLNRLKLAGFYTLMCGDGTNDVGALKQAHVGVALLDGTVEDMQKIQKRAAAARQKAMLDKQEAQKEMGCTRHCGSC